MNTHFPLLLRITPFFYYPSPKKGWPIRFDPIGGVQIQSWQETMLVSHCGIKQVVLTLGMKGVPSLWNMDEKTEVRAVRIPWPPIRSQIDGTWQLVASWGLGVLAWMAHNTGTSLQRQIKLVHCHCDGTLWPLLVGPIVAHWARAPLILTIHCSRIGTYHPTTFLSRLWHPFVEQLEIAALSRADRIITLTQRLADIYANRLVLPRERLAVIPDAVDPEKFQRERVYSQVELQRQKLGIPKDKRIIMFAGRIAFEKGWQYLVEAATLLPQQDMHFVFCGDGPQRDALEKLLDELKQRQRATITGFLPHEWMPTTLSLADIVVMPSIHEELGSSLLEAMLMERPIIASKVGGIQDLITDGENGLLIPPQNPSEIAQAITRLVNDPDFSTQLGQQGSFYVRSHYSTEAKIRRILDIYQQLGFHADETEGASLRDCL